MLGDQTVFCEPPTPTRSGWKLRRHICESEIPAPLFVVVDQGGTVVGGEMSMSAVRKTIIDLSRSAQFKGVYSIRHAGDWGTAEIFEAGAWEIRGPGSIEGPGFIIV